MPLRLQVVEQFGHDPAELAQRVGCDEPGGFEGLAAHARRGKARERLRTDRCKDSSWVPVLLTVTTMRAPCAGTHRPLIAFENALSCIKCS